jgi:transposase
VVGERGPRVCHRAPSNTDGSTAVKHYAAIDVSLELSSVCIVDAAGKVVKESKVETQP